MYLVTGAGGFIGQHLVRKLAKKYKGKRCIIGLDIRGIGELREEKNVTELIRDIGKISVDDLADSMKEISEVIHLAAISSADECKKNLNEAFITNVRGTLNLLRASVQAGVKKFMFISSAAVYGESRLLYINESAPVNPISFYGLTKVMGEESCRMIANTSDLEIKIIRLFNVYGIDQWFSKNKFGVIPIFISNVVNHEDIQIYGGQQIRDFINVKDVIEIIIRLQRVRRRSALDIFNVGTGVATSISNLANLINGIAVARFGIEMAQIKIRQRKDFDILQSVADISAFNIATEYRPKISLTSGIYEIMKKIHQGDSAN